MTKDQLTTEIIELKSEIIGLKERMKILETPKLLEPPKTQLFQHQVCDQYGISRYHIDQLKKKPEFKDLWIKEGQVIIILPEFIELMVKKYSHYFKR